MNASENKKINILNDQIIAGYVLAGIEHKREELLQRLSEITNESTLKMQAAHDAFNNAMSHIENLRDFVSPSNHHAILGRMATKHGEIAEHIEVEIRNGWSVLRRLAETADIESVGRTAPEDYIINGIPVQSKFINGAKNCLEHVLGHMDKYPDFAKDASVFGYPGKSGIYHIPKDYYDILQRIYRGESVELGHKSIEKCKILISVIETKTGKPFSEVVQPGISTYREVQLGVVDSTIDRHESEFSAFHKEEITEIQRETKAQKVEAQHITDPSWGEAIKFAGIGAVISGTTSGGIKIYAKIRDGKSLGTFTVDDWKEVGWDFTKGGARGGISGLGIYGLTRLGNFSAPFAGAMVSSAIGLTSLTLDYRAGTITENDFSQAANALSVEAGISAIGSALGQAVIPVPVLGAIIGAVTAKAALEITKYIVGNKEKDLIRQMESDYQQIASALEQEAREVFVQIESYFSKLHGFISAALSQDAAVRAYGSIELCRFLGVEETEIIKNVDELDSYMLG